MGEYEDCLKDGKDAAVCLKESLLRNGKPTMKKYDEYAKSEGGEGQASSQIPPSNQIQACAQNQTSSLLDKIIQLYDLVIHPKIDLKLPQIKIQYPNTQLFRKWS